MIDKQVFRMELYNKYCGLYTRISSAFVTRMLVLFRLWRLKLRITEENGIMAKSSKFTVLPSLKRNGEETSRYIYISRAWSQKGVSGILGEFEFFISKYISRGLGARRAYIYICWFVYSLRAYFFCFFTFNVLWWKSWSNAT